jgi:hypothetical protein
MKTGTLQLVSVKKTRLPLQAAVTAQLQLPQLNVGAVPTRCFVECPAGQL